MILWLFRLCCFLPAFLLFSIQPMTGKDILPLFGGSPQVWLVTLAFFQSTLVGGYGLVFLMRRWPAYIAGAILSVAIAAGIGLLITMPGIAPGTTDGAFGLYLALWRNLGLPLMALSALAPMIQRLFAARFPGNPYRLYAISNIGSLLGLLSYPFIIEPFFGLSLQKISWVYGYAVLLLLLAGCTAAAWKKEPASITTVDAKHPTARIFLLWVFIAAITSSMLSGATSVISTDVGSFPLLWVLPLALFLGTFILAFGEKLQAWLPGITFYGALGIILFLILALLGDVVNQLGPVIFFLLILAAFFTSAFLCHVTLYNTRPDPAHLSIFYLALAVGGALGGSFNAFAVPVMVPSGHEFYYVLIISLLFIPAPLDLTRATQKIPHLHKIIRTGLITSIGLCLFLAYGPDVPEIVGLIFSVFIMLGLLVLILNQRALIIALLVCSLLIVVTQNRDILYQTRNFFGLWRVYDRDGTDTLAAYRVLLHGTTDHGREPHDPAYKGVPVSYYGPHGPAGDVLLSRKMNRVAVVGLGSGQMACYRPVVGALDIYEIDPAVVAIAKNWFHYLQDCGVDTLVLGDARLSLAQSSEKYDLIVLDAFSSDAIPAHLLTVEAARMYLQRLAPNGILLFHISNRFFDLRGPLAANARELGLTSVTKLYQPGDTAPYDTPSSWVAMTMDSTEIDLLKSKDWTVPTPAGKPWTDDYTSLLRAFKLSR